MMFWQWLVPWDFSPAAASAMGAVAILYARGSRSGDVLLWQKLCFWGGLLSLYAVLLTRFDYYAEHAFFMGRVQHAVLQHFGSFLIALAAPAAALKAGGLRLPGIPKVLSNPVMAVLLFDGLILFWLIPSVHFIAMLDWRLYRLMNWSMVLNGLMFWSIVLNPQSRHSAGCRMAMMLAVIPAQIAAGLLLTFSPHELYPVYSICGRAFGGMTPLEDQQIGGTILWIHGAMMSIIGILIVVRREIVREAR